MPVCRALLGRIARMSRYRVVFQDSGKDTRRAETTYIRVRIWADDKYIGVWFGLLNERSKLRYMPEPEQVRHYQAVAPVALALAIQEALELKEFNVPRDVPLHPTKVLQLALEDRDWAQGDEIMTFEV